MLTRVIARSLSTSMTTKLYQNAEIAEKRVVELRHKLEEIKKVKIEEKIRELTNENKILLAKVEKAKADLIKQEVLNGKKQYPLPSKSSSNVPIQTTNTPIEVPTEQAPKKAKKEKEPAKKNKEPAAAVDSVVDVRKLDLRIGKIIEINKHPDADSLYVEKIDCGEENPRTVVSGLVNHVPIDEMRDRIVMVLCNLKPVKMRGVTSEAMVMCASSPEKVEVLIPPQGAAPGDLVSCEGYPREPEPQLNPKKKIFETCAPDLKTNDDRVACYKDSPLVVLGKGPIIAPTLKCVHVK
ncbi:aminoacyl tRNA synthase complex-interacting multifunctional protein 1 [Aricia agestis]|uniref:aminoacyl tRNA synthase complex-interacting multifunctional protein 1 n=1 Tax=Aricia agestis TaxID=91739 RepID=UPI001C20928B|nr:aminoacyl tRNA synthase complex-interacting multifunctional protein 1 [Aricia agestis]